MIGTADPIAVIEAGYRFDASHRDWLRGIAEALQPLIDGGTGVVAHTLDVARSPQEWFDDAVLLGFDRSHFDIAVELFCGDAVHGQRTGRPYSADLQVFAAEALSSTVESYRQAGVFEPGSGVDLTSWNQYCRVLGIEDNIVFRTVEPGSRFLVVVAGTRRVCRIRPRAKRLWARVAAHLAAARRLRAAFANEGGAPAAEAVFAPSGRLEHAEEPAKGTGARAALHEAVVAKERARRRQGRRDPETAVDAWTALVSGRWSLVDHFERDGRRYLLAIPNKASVPDPRALTERERAVTQLAALGKSNKLIAYELGLASATVANYLSAVARKLGVGSRTELVFLLAALSGRAHEQGESHIPAVADDPRSASTECAASSVQRN